MKFNIPAEHKDASGVYIIRNTVNSKVYVGSARNFRKRHASHRSELTSGRHGNRLLLRFVAKYGIDKLSFELLDIISPENELLIQAEQARIDEFDAANHKVGYNIQPRAGRIDVGRAWPASTHSPSAVAKRVELRRLRGNLNHSEETKKKISASKKGVKLSSEQLASRFTSEAYQNRSPETREKLRLAHKGRKAAPGTLAALRNPINIAKRLAALRSGGAWNKGNSNKLLVNCERCHKEFSTSPSRLQKFCSRDCWRTSFQEKSTTPIVRERLASINSGKPKSVESIAKRSATMAARALEERGRACQVCDTIFAPKNGQNDQKFCSRPCFYKRAVSEETRAKHAASSGHLNTPEARVKAYETRKGGKGWVQGREQVAKRLATIAAKASSLQLSIL